MAYLLTNLLQDAYLELGQGMQADATGGTTGTVVDTKLSGTNQEFKDWEIFITKTTDGLAPQGEYRRVSAYDDGTFTVEEAFSAAVQDGDEYLIVSTLYPIKTMIRSANMGLQKLGNLVLVDKATLTEDDTVEYPLSVVWKRTRPLRIDIERTDEKWEEISPSFWEIEPSAPGVNAILVFRYDIRAGYNLRIWYEGIHPQLVDFDDIVAETIPANVAWLATAHQALVWQNGRQQGGEEYLLQKENATAQALQMAVNTWVMYKPRRKPKLVVVK